MKSDGNNELAKSEVKRQGTMMKANGSAGGQRAGGIDQRRPTVISTGAGNGGQQRQKH